MGRVEREKVKVNEKMGGCVDFNAEAHGLFWA